MASTDRPGSNSRHLEETRDVKHNNTTTSEQKFVILPSRPREITSLNYQLKSGREWFQNNERDTDKYHQSLPDDLKKQYKELSSLIASYDYCTPEAMYLALYQDKVKQEKNDELSKKMMESYFKKCDENAKKWSSF